MAPKRPAPLEDPPAASSSEQEDVESDEEEELESGQEEEEEESSGDEEEETPAQKQQQQQQQQVKKAASSSVDLPRAAAAAVEKKSSKVSGALPQSSSSDEGSDSDSDKPLSQQVTDLNVKPISSKPADVPAKIEKPRPKLTVTALPALTPTKSAAKRPISKGGESSDSKRAKNNDAEADPVESEKKPLFQRLWTEDDEIVILKGIIDFTSKKGIDPSSDMDAFYEFIKKSLESDGTRTQLMDKIRRLKKKYRTNAAKVNKGKRTFPNAHEQLTFDLSKKLWENSDSTNGGSVDQPKPNGKAKKVKKIENLVTIAEKAELPVAIRVPVANDVSPKKDISNESILFNNSVGSMGLDESFMKEGLNLIDSAKKLELETKWRSLQVAETEMFLRRIELVREQTKLVLEAFNKH